MISRKRVKDFNKILTCLLCKGYLIEATTINICMHSFCRSCIVKHIKLFETCPICDCEIRLGNLRPDIRLRSIVYKIIPGLYAKERQNISHDGFEQRIFLNGTSSGAHTLVSKYEKQTFDICYEDEKLAKQYFYDPEEPISLSLEYHMESIFGSNNITSISNNIPQVRYLQAPAAFKVLHLKKFLSSKYDLSNLKKPMCIDIIYEGDILSDEFSLMDIAYTFNWEREAPLKLFYRIYKSKKHNNNNEINLIKKALINQPFVKLSTADFRATMEQSLSKKVSDAVNCNNHAQESSSTHHNNNNNNNNNKKMNTNSTGSIQNQNQQQQSKPSEAPRHDLKIIIAKKPSSKNSKVFDVSNNKIKLNKPNSYISKVLTNDCERLRGDVDNSTSLEIASTSEMKTTLSKKTGTVSHHDLKFENKSNSSGSTKSSSRHNNNTDSHDFYEYKINEGEKEKQQKRESTKHTNSSTSSSSFSHHSTAGRNEEKKFKVKSNLSLNIPKLKIELPSLKTKITVPKTPNESYSISKSPFSNNAKCEPQIKRVRFDMSNTPSYSSSKAVYDFDDEIESMNSCVDQKKYAARIGLKPVEKKVDSIILHRKRKKSKHSKDIEHSSKRPKLHVSSSSYDDESLKLKLKIMGGKNCKNDKKFNNNEEEAYEKTCNFKASHHHKTTDSSSINVQHEYTTKKQEQEKQKEAVIELENHKYSVTEQKIPKSSNSNQPMVFIPKLVLQKSTSVPNTFTASSPTSTSSDNSFNKSNSSNNNNNNTNSSNINSKREETTKVQRRNSIYSDQHKKQQEQSLLSSSSSSSSLPSDAEKSKDLKIKIKTLDKLSGHDSNSVNNQQKLMKPPTAKMGSPSSDIQAQITSTLASSPIRPNSIPASLKLSPISATAASPTISVKSEMQLQNLKRSLSLGAEKSPHCYINPYAKSNTEMFTRDPPLIEIPPLIPTSPTIRNFYNSNNNNYNNQSVGKMSPVSISKVPNINVKDPTKLFPNACPSVEILKIPQAAPIVNRHQQHQPSVKNIKLNRQMPPTIPLEKIKQTAQNHTLQKILPKSLQSTQNFLKSSGYHGKIDLLHRNTNNNNNNNNNLSFNTSDLCQNPISQDLTLERYHYELSKDIAKLDQSLSLEKNFEHWGKQKMQEFSKISDIKSFATSPTAKSLLNQQNMNLSVRNIPNPSALMMFRNQANNLHNSNKSKSPTSTSSSPKLPTVKETVSSSTSDQCSDIEEILSKSTITKSTEKPFSENYSQNSQQSKISSSLSSNHGKINDKKSIEKLTEYLRLTATAAKSREMRQDDDNNNNNSSPKNDKNFNLIDGRKQKSSSSDVICIDS